MAKTLTHSRYPFASILVSTMRFVPAIGLQAEWMMEPRQGRVGMGHDAPGLVLCHSN